MWRLSMGKLNMELTSEQLFHLEQIKRECSYYTHEKLQTALIQAVELKFKYQNAFKSIKGWIYGNVATSLFQPLTKYAVLIKQSNII